MGYTIALVAVSILPSALGFAGIVYAASAVVLGTGFLVRALRVLADGDFVDGSSRTRDAPARATFRYSLAYLAVLFAALAIDRYVG